MAEHAYREYARGCLPELARLNPAGDPRQHMRVMARAWCEERSNPVPLELGNPGGFAGLLPWLLGGAAILAFHKQIGAALGGVLHLGSTVPAAVAQASNGQPATAPSSAAASSAGLLQYVSSVGSQTCSGTNCFLINGFQNGYTGNGPWLTLGELEYATSLAGFATNRGSTLTPPQSNFHGDILAMMRDLGGTLGHSITAPNGTTP